MSTFPANVSHKSAAMQTNDTFWCWHPGSMKCWLILTCKCRTTTVRSSQNSKLSCFFLFLNKHPSLKNKGICAVDCGILKLNALIECRKSILQMCRGFLVIRKTVSEMTCKHLAKSWPFSGQSRYRTYLCQTFILQFIQHFFLSIVITIAPLPLIKFAFRHCAILSI